MRFCSRFPRAVSVSSTGGDRVPPAGAPRGPPPRGDRPGGSGGRPPRSAGRRARSATAARPDRSPPERRPAPPVSPSGRIASFWRRSSSRCAAFIDMPSSSRGSIARSVAPLDDTSWNPVTDHQFVCHGLSCSAPPASPAAWRMAEALVRRGQAPVLVARSDARLRESARGLDVAVADAARPVSLAQVVEKGDAVPLHGGPVREVGDAAAHAESARVRTTSTPTASLPSPAASSNTTARTRLPRASAC